jgi:hypothetical protein
MMGMKRIKRGKNCRGAFKYVIKGGKLIGGNMTGVSVSELEKEFKAVQKLRPDIEKPVWHESLRLPKHESLSPEKWVVIADDFMKRMGFSDHQRIIGLHDEPDGQHVHIVANRIGLDGSVFLGRHDSMLATTVIRQLELDYGLTPYVPDPDKPKRKAISAGEKGLAERGETVMKIQLQAIIDVAAADKPAFSEFVARLEDAGATIRPSGKTGAAQGVSFELDGVAFKGSDLGKSYAWKQLQARIDYDLERDQHVIDKLRARALEDEQEEGGELMPAAHYPAATTTYKGPQRTLELTLEKDGDAYKWKGRDRVALIDKGDSISVLSRADTAIRASLQLSKDKGWKSVRATGGLEFQRKSWLIGSEMGLVIEGYTPTQADHDELKRRLEQRERLRHGQNIRNENQGGSPGTRENVDSRAVGTGATNGDRPQPNSGRSQAVDRRSERGEGAARQQLNQTVDIHAAADTRSTDLADVRSIRSNRDSVGAVRLAATDVSDIAAPIQQDRETVGTGRAERSDTLRPDEISREHAAKIAAWEQQSAALDAEKYRITLKPRKEKDRNGRKLFDQNYGNAGKKRDREAIGVEEKFWTKEEIAQEITKLRAKNAQGYDVYVTPIGRYHYLCVDDMSTDKEKALLAAGIEPALIQRSSDNNKQAIILIDKENIKGEQQLANQIVTRLNKKFGDPKFSGVVHPFRMAGFSNKKNGKNNYITTVEKFIRRTCKITSVAMQKLRDDDRLEKQEADKLKKQKSIKAETDKEYSRRITEIDNAQQIGGEVVVSAYRREVKKTVGLAKRNNWTLDWSRVDFSATKELIKNGYRPDLIKKAIIEASPSLADRHKDAVRYASDTVRNAAADPEVKRHLAAQTQQAKLTGPSLGF